MTFGRKDKQIDKTTIAYNSHITISGIPLEAYDYVVNGKSAIEWIMERYQVTRDKDSGIANDPREWEFWDMGAMGMMGIMIIDPAQWRA
jgi:predicted helicase